MNPDGLTSTVACHATAGPSPPVPTSPSGLLLTRGLHTPLLRPRVSRVGHL